MRLVLPGPAFQCSAEWLDRWVHLCLKANGLLVTSILQSHLFAFPWALEAPLRAQGSNGAGVIVGI